MNGKLLLAKFGAIFIVICSLVIGYNKAESTDRYLEAVKIGDKWGFKDVLTGKIVIKPKFDDVNFFSEGLAGVSIGGKWSFIDETGTIAIKTQFDFVSHFSEGMALVNIGGKPVNGRKCDLTSCIKGGKWGFIDKTGRTIIGMQFNDASDFSEGLAPVKVGDKWGYIDKTGKMVISPQFDLASDFREGLAAVWVEKKVGYIDKTGKLVINPQFDFAHSFREGLAAVKVGDKWGYINKTGKIVIKPQFDFAGSFFMGKAGVNIGDNKDFIDRTGKPFGNWKYITESRDTIYYYDPKSIIRPSKNIVRAWIKVVLTEEGRDREIQIRKERGLPIKGFENYDHEKSLKEIDCSGKRLRTISFAMYDTEGNVIDSFSFPPNGEWNYIVPESIGEAFHESLCPQKIK